MATKFVNKKLMKRDQVTHELGILQNLQHPLLIGLLDTFETPTSYVLVLEMYVHAGCSPLSNLNSQGSCCLFCKRDRNWDFRITERSGHSLGASQQW